MKTDRFFAPSFIRAGRLSWRAALGRALILLALLLLALVPVFVSAQSYGNLSVSGHVIHANANPSFQAGDRVLICDVAKSKWIPTVTDNTGTYRFYDLAPGAVYLLRAYIDSRIVAERQFTFQGAALQIDLPVDR